MEEFDAAHEWTLVKLNGNYYHVDPTYEEGYGSEGLLFFGMTNDRREFFSEFPYVFRSFWQGANVESKPGSGMGMYTARKMAKQLKGEVYVRALKEQGEMEFTLII